jgi:hypothetical protein
MALNLAFAMDLTLAARPRRTRDGHRVPAPPGADLIGRHLLG